MRKFMPGFVLTFIISLTSCSPKTVKYSPGDTWSVQLNETFSLECYFDEISEKQLVFSLTKDNPEDEYNFAIKANLPCEYIYVNGELLFQKSPGVIPQSFYDVEHFQEKNKIVVPFRKGTEEFKKINIIPYQSFLKEYDRDFIGIRIILYKF